MTEKSWDEQRFRDIEYNLKTIHEEIARAAEDSGRTEADIDFMAVTKTVEPERVGPGGLVAGPAAASPREVGRWPGFHSIGFPCDVLH